MVNMKISTFVHWILSFQLILIVSIIYTENHHVSNCKRELCFYYKSFFRYISIFDRTSFDLKRRETEISHPFIHRVEFSMLLGKDFTMHISKK